MFTTVGGISSRSTPICLCLNRWQLLLIIIFLQLASCHKNMDPRKYCPPSSCGSIKNISYPFRLDTDPPNCGFSDKNFTLSCHNNSSLFWYINNNRNPIGGRFLVKGINYHNFTIHLVDPGIQPNNCSSLPTSPISKALYSNPYYTTTIRWKSSSEAFGFNSDDLSLSTGAVLISCDREQVYHHPISFRVNPVKFTAPCKCKIIKNYSYVIWYISESSLEPEMESCSINMITLLPSTASFPYDYRISYQEIHTELSYGFHVSWFPVFCQQKCSSPLSRCLIDEANRPTCVPFDSWRAYYLKAWFIDTYAGYSVHRYWDTIYKILGWVVNICILVGGIHVVISLVGSPCVIIFLIYRWRRRHLSFYGTIEEFLHNHNDLMPIRYSYRDIKTMTSHFKDKLGEGGFGCVYKGKLRSCRLAAIKILGKPYKVTNGQDFMNEVATLGRIHHVNVVQLVGYCAEQSKHALVYEFMPNGSLDKYIFAKEGIVSLSWDKLFEISLGVARGIEYLHGGCAMKILHFDIKPHNILLDENFIPKVSDFGLAKLYPTTKDTIASLTVARGTIGYMAPELFYKNIGRVSYKADVYSFGMLLLEIAGKRKNLNAFVEKSSQIYFPSWVYDQVSNGDDIEIGDNATDEEIEIVKKMIIVGLWCIQMNPINRPSMNKVLEMLEGDIENLEMPPKSTLYLEEMPKVAETNESSSMSDNSSESISLIESEG